jgi:hypothetical protein
MNGNPPQSKQNILDSLANLKVPGMEFWRSIQPQRFASPFGEAWSPADTVRHLIKSTAPVAQALFSPKPGLQAMFGTASRASMPYPELVDRYHAALAAGGNAGSFAPSPSPIPADLRAWQKDLVSKCESEIAALSAAAEPWSESDLDLYQLPHPLLGKLTVREMLFFTLYHFEHHRKIVAARLETTVSAQTPAANRSTAQ